MVICEYEFEQAGSQNSTFSQLEIDLFSTKEYRLSLRKNLISGCFEFYKRLWKTKTDEIVGIYANLDDAIKELNQKLGRDTYIVCIHPDCELYCPKRKYITPKDNRKK